MGYFNGLVAQDCGNFIANAMKLPQLWAKPLICHHHVVFPS